MNPKTKRILALIAVILLVALNILTFILGINPKEEVNRLAWPCFFLSWLFPLMIFLNLKIIDYIQENRSAMQEDTEESPKENRSEIFQTSETSDNQ